MFEDQIVLISFVAILPGLISGRWLNHLVFRLLNDYPVFKKHRLCHTCDGDSSSHQNLPLLGYFLSKGRCESCGEPIHWRVPLIEFISGLLWFWALFNYPTAESLLFIIMVSCLLVITFIDLSDFIIPLSMIITAATSVLMYNLLIVDDWQIALWGIVAGVGYLGGMMLLTTILFRRQTMGFGDLQLIAVLGAWVGVMNILATVLLGAMMALFSWIFISMRRGYDRDRPLLFGPFLSMAAVILYIAELDWQQILGFLL